MTNRLVAAVLVASLGACTREAGRIADMPRSGLIGQGVTVTTVDGTEEEADIQEVTLKHPGDPRADVDAVIVRNRGDGAMLDETTLAKLEVSNHVMGAMEGLGLGALAGGAIGAVVGAAGGDDPPCDPGQFCIFRLSAGEKAALVGMGFGVLGALAGIVVGGIVGAHDIYRKDDVDVRTAVHHRGARPASSGYAVTPIGPAGSVAGLGITF